MVNVYPSLTMDETDPWPLIPFKLVITSIGKSRNRNDKNNSMEIEQELKWGCMVIRSLGNKVTLQGLASKHVHTPIKTSKS